MTAPHPLPYNTNTDHEALLLRLVDVVRVHPKPYATGPPPLSPLTLINSNTNHRRTKNADRAKLA
jgi:hypothetical protein